MFDNIVPICVEPGVAMLEPVPLRKTKRPRVIPDKVDRSRKDAVVYLSDVYLGGGLNFAYSSIDFDAGGDDSEKDLGVNLLGGVQLPLGPLTGIGELRITIAGSEQYTLGVGLLF